MCQGDQTTEDNTVSQEGVPPGYEAVSLIEALNGPCGLPPPNTMEGNTVKCYLRNTVFK